MYEINIITISLLFFSVIAGAIFVETLHSRKEKNIQLLITFSGAYLLVISFLHLLPNLFEKNINYHIGFYILAGFLIQIILEYFSQGIEHEHFHNRNIIPTSVMISLCIHAILEGIPLSGNLDNHRHNSLLSGIILHKIPVSVVLMSLFVKNNIRKTKAYIYLFLFAIMTPIGVLIGGHYDFFYNFQNEIIAIITGMLIYISTSVLLEISNGHKFSLQKILAIIISICIAVLTI